MDTSRNRFRKYTQRMTIVNQTKIKKIGCLAPEIPSLSATFVYNEILKLEKNGVEVIPISVHYPNTVAEQPFLNDLKLKTYYLYNHSLFHSIKVNLYLGVKCMKQYLGALYQMVGDIIKCDKLSYAIKIPYQFMMGAVVADILTKEGCELLHVHFAHVPTQIAMYAAKISDTPYTFTSHANDLFERGNLIQKKVNRSFCSITISEYNKQYLVSKGVESNKIRIVRCGVDSKGIMSKPIKKDRGKLVVGTLARIVEKKGIDTLLESTKILYEKSMPIELKVAGDGPLLEAFKKKYDSLIRQGIICFEGALRNDFVFDWLEELDLFVLACKKDKYGDQDGIPVVLMEAMAKGIPVLSTEISGIPELVVNDVTGFMVPPNNSISLADKIEQLANDISKLERVRKPAIRHIQKEFDADVNIFRLINIFEEATK